MIWDHSVYTLSATQKMSQALREVQRAELARRAAVRSRPGLATPARLMSRVARTLVPGYADLGRPEPFHHALSEPSRQR